VSIELGLPGLHSGIDGVPTFDGEGEQTAKEYTSDQEVRWCPGCGDYAVLKAVQGFLPQLGLRRENIVFVSGIGCSSRFPYYLDTYGMHSIHGRAPSIATGIATAREDLSVWVVTGDGDALSIGGNHLIHALRRNVNLKILLFNNRIYGLTKGQYSPTSEVGKITKSSPFGSLDTPFNPVSVALAAEATFVSRTHDMDRPGMLEAFRRAHEHQGSAFVEIYQNCNVFNDGAFEGITAKEARADMLIQLRHGEPIRFGTDNERGVILNAFGECEIVEVADVGEDRLLVHDETREDPALAFALSRLSSSPTMPTPMGVFRSIQRPTYEGEVQRQLVGAVERQGPGDLHKLIGTGATWEVN
jgi:2-oxoglutarate ferredoxin oxidoreductase subunit beta